MVADEENYELGSNAPQQEAFVASNRVSAAAPPLPKEKLVEPSLSLRTFFPETWLFSLDIVEPEASLQRYEMTDLGGGGLVVVEACMHLEADVIFIMYYKRNM